MYDWSNSRLCGLRLPNTLVLSQRRATTLVPVPALASPHARFEIEAYAAVRQEPLRKVDVVVVGAGLSGLKAAWEVQKAGLSCIVVEARDRVGGKTLSVSPLGDERAVDLGGAWINDTNQSEIFKLAQTLGLKLVVQKADGDVIYEDFDSDLGRAAYGDTPDTFVEPNAAEKIQLLTEELEKACHELDIRDPASTGKDLDKLTLSEWATTKTSSMSALAMLQLSTRALMGIEPSETSGFMRMRYDMKHGGQHLRFVKGSQSVSLGLVDLLHRNSVVLSSPVSKSRTRGDFLCQRVILSVQTILYKSIAFDPPLPSLKLELAKHGVQSFSYKHVIMYSEPWWRNAGLSGAFISFKGPVSTARDTSNDRVGQFSLTCFANGDLGRQMSKRPKAERTKAILDHLDWVFSPYVEVPKPIAVVQRSWSKDLWSRVCTMPVQPPGIMSLQEHALRAPHGKIHFVGTETSYEWAGYMDGAARSGDRGAKEVIHALI
ncbi:hypothetical protein BDW72DRAFT_207149 [Aspergillus terricola var. indicus]